MTAYLPPEIPDHEQVSRRDCITRAQRALEAAEIALDEAADSGLAPADVVALAAARARVGQGWAALADMIGGPR